MTTKLNKADAEHIAKLINNIAVAKYMHDENPAYWFGELSTATIELADVYGIELPSLAVCRRYIATTEEAAQ